MNDTSLCKEIIQSINIIPSHFLKHSDLRQFDQGLFSELNKASLQIAWFSQTIQLSNDLKVGSGRKILFWRDICLHDCSLSSKFPRLYSISLKKNQVILALGFWRDNLWHWDFKWRRSLFSWEQSQVTEVLELLSSFKPDQMGFD